MEGALLLLPPPRPEAALLADAEALEVAGGWLMSPISVAGRD